MVPARQTSPVAPSARDDGDAVNPTRRLHRPHHSQQCRHEGAAAGILFVWAGGPGILGLFALLTRGKTVVIRSAHERPASRKLAFPATGLPAWRDDRARRAGRCLASLSVSLLFRLRRGSPKRSGGARVMPKAPCREDGWLTKQGFEIVAHRAHLAGPPLRRCCREVKVSTPVTAVAEGPSVPPSRPRVAPRSLS
jgi:hypothetical protein